MQDINESKKVTKVINNFNVRTGIVKSDIKCMDKRHFCNQSVCFFPSNVPFLFLPVKLQYPYQRHESSGDICGLEVTAINGVISLLHKF